MSVFPYISVGSVEAALASIRYAAKEKQFDALLSLAIVDEYLLYHDSPQSDQRRQFALREILINTIIDRYTHLRRAVLEQNYVFPNTLSELHDITSVDAASEHGELRAWSLLFIKYGTALTETQPDQLETLYSVSSRSIRRYLKYGYRALTDVLIAKEQKARQKMHRRRLAASLPSHQLSFHVGRQRQIQRLKTIYQTQRGVCFLVTGDEGIGKTHLLNVFMHRQLRTDSAPQHLVWMYQPRTIQSVIAHLFDQLLHDSRGLNLKDYAQVHRVSLVLDDAENLLPDIPKLSAELGQVDILISATRCQNRKTLQLLHAHVHLGPLSPSETEAYICNLRKTSNLIVGSEARHTGNPGRIRAMAHAELQAGKATMPLDIALTDMPSEVTTRLLVAIFMPNEPIKLPSNLSTEKFAGFIEKHQNHYYINSREAQKLQSAWQAGQHRKLLHDLISQIISSDNQPNPVSLLVQIDLAEKILTQIPNLNAIWRKKLLLHYWERASKHNRLRTWLTLLEAFLVDVNASQGEILHAVGIIQDQLGNRSIAANTLESAIQNAGMTGDFDLQAQALLSLSTVLRRTGKYESALKNIRQARRQTTDQVVQQKTWLEEAKIMLEADDRTRLAHCLEQVTLSASEMPSVAILHSQLAYATGDYDQGIEYARQIEASNPAHAQALMAQGYMLLGKPDQAENRFMHAMEKMKDAEDTYTLARVGTNLAACLIQHEEWERAYALLKQSKRYQIENHDIVGLMVTKHNFEIIQKNLSYLWRIST